VVHHIDLSHTKAKSVEQEVGGGESVVHAENQLGAIPSARHY
jgi:hypothetical protein